MHIDSLLIDKVWDVVYRVALLVSDEVLVLISESKNNADHNMQYTGMIFLSKIQRFARDIEED